MTTQGEPAQIVYDDEVLRVIWQPGASDFLLVTFSDLISKAVGVDFFGDTPARKGAIAALGFVAKHGDWYVNPSMAAAIETVRGRLDRYRTRVAYGGSMGGYAAAKYARALGATQVIALCPQWSLDRAECEGIDPGWGSFFTPAMQGMGVRGEDVCGRLYLFADLGDPQDAFHAKMLARAHGDTDVINVPLVGHSVGSVLAGSENLFEMLRAAMAEDVRALRRFATRARRGHYLRTQALLRRGYERHRALFLPPLLRLALEQPYVLTADPRFLGDCLAHAVERGRRDDAVKLLDRAREVLADTAVYRDASELAKRLLG